LEVLDRAYSRKSKRYIPMSSVYENNSGQSLDNSNHKNPIKKVTSNL